MPDNKLTDKEYKMLSHEECLQVIANLTAEVEKQKKKVEARNILIAKQQAENEKLRNCVKTEEEVRTIANATIQAGIKIIKVEAYKEFAERLKEKHFLADNEDVDNLLKELVGE